MKRHLALGIVLLCLCRLAFAAAAQQVPRQDACDTQSSTLEMTQCMAVVLPAAERKLAQAYRHALKSTPLEERRHLVSAQQLWLRHRNAACKIEATGYSTLRGPVYDSCIAAQDDLRSRELKAAASE